MVDIFELKEQYPLPDDDHTETYQDLDMKEQPLTIERLTPMVANALMGHHSLCGMPECLEVELPESMAARHIAEMMGQPKQEPVLFFDCLVNNSPTTPERRAANKSIDEQVEADIREAFPGMVPYLDQSKKRRMGFDIHRDET